MSVNHIFVSEGKFSVRMDFAEYKSIQEHTKFLVFHMQQIFNVSYLEQDCTLQCKDGSTVASSLVLGAMSPLLCGFLRETLSTFIF